jgi:tight adherence protein B
VAAAVTVGVVSGWPVAAVAAAVGGWVMAGRFTGGRRRTGDIARLEALAGWCEQLRDLLAASHGLLAAIAATAATAPRPIRAEVGWLETQLRHGDPAVALRGFADRFDDPDADLVVSVLTLALSRSGRTAELLSELADTTRQRVAMRRRIDTERAGDRSEARAVGLISLVAIVGVMILGRGGRFGTAYRTASGQLVLAVVFALLGGGLGWLARLSRPEHTTRFLTGGRR